jgi:hypothetical protein
LDEGSTRKVLGGLLPNLSQVGYPDAIVWDLKDGESRGVSESGIPEIKSGGLEVSQYISQFTSLFFGIRHWQNHPRDCETIQNLW